MIPSMIKSQPKRNGIAIMTRENNPNSKLKAGVFKNSAQAGTKYSTHQYQQIIAPVAIKTREIRVERRIKIETSLYNDISVSDKSDLKYFHSVEHQNRLRLPHIAKTQFFMKTEYNNSQYIKNHKV